MLLTNKSQSVPRDICVAMAAIHEAYAKMDCPCRVVEIYDYREEQYHVFLSVRVWSPDFPISTKRDINVLIKFEPSVPDLEPRTRSWFEHMYISPNFMRGGHQDVKKFVCRSKCDMERGARPYYLDFTVRETTLEDQLTEVHLTAETFEQFIH